jgi:hypothetical protein
MNELYLLGRLGTRSRGEAEPTIDVTARVIQRIARRRSRMIDPRLALVSVGACVLSALAIAATRPAEPANDTLAALSEAAFNSTDPEALLRVLEP